MLDVSAEIEKSSETSGRTKGEVVREHMTGKAVALTRFMIAEPGLRGSGRLAG
jgi:hypothetical protein